MLNAQVTSAAALQADENYDADAAFATAIPCAALKRYKTTCSVSHDHLQLGFFGRFPLCGSRLGLWSAAAAILHLGFLALRLWHRIDHSFLVRKCHNAVSSMERDR